MVGRILGFVLLTGSLVHAQHAHFPAGKWKEKKLDHFALRMDSTNADPAARNAEKVWEICVAVMPGMKQEFEKNGFRTPSGGEASDDAPFRFTVYLLGNGSDYDEHQMFKLCRVHYLDFEAYYEDQKADIKKGETLGPDQSWARVLNKMCKKDQRVSLEKVCSAEILNLTPETSGYIFALTCFLVRDEPARVKYRDLVAKSAGGTKIDKGILLSCYGYADDAALEKEWYAWVESRDFK